MLHAILGSIFDLFLLSTLIPRILKIVPPLQREHDFSKNRLSKLFTFLTPFGCQLASIFPPKMHQNPSKNRFQKASIFWIDFGIDLLSILAPFWEPSWGHWAPRGTEKRPWIVSQIDVGTPFLALGSQQPPKSDFDRFFNDFWSILGRFLIDFSLIFIHLLIDFSSRPGGMRDAIE